MTQVSPGTGEVALCIGVAHNVAQIIAPGSMIILARHNALSKALLVQTRADTIIIPLFGDGFDGTQIAERLARMGYTGALVVVTAPLPSPQMVWGELCNAFGATNLRLLEMP